MRSTRALPSSQSTTTMSPARRDWARARPAEIERIVAATTTSRPARATSIMSAPSLYRLKRDEAGLYYREEVTVERLSEVSRQFHVNLHAVRPCFRWIPVLIVPTLVRRNEGSG